MKKCLPLLILATLGTVAAKADTISITLDKATQIATPGSTLAFYGTITNLSSSTVFLNGDYFTLAGTGYIINDQFFNTVPISLAPGANSGDIELFDVTAPASPAATSGNYGLTGGPDFNASNNLGSVGFNVNPVPAPEISSSLAISPLLLIAGGIAVLRGRRRIRGTA